jgi:translocator protein
MARKKTRKQIRKKTPEKKGPWNYLKKESSFKRLNWKVFIISLVIVIIVAGIGSLFTDTGSWYQSIKPSITPPNLVFPIVWTVLFYLIAVSLYYSWLSSKDKEKLMVIILFGINFILNILWTFIYFKNRNPLIAFIDIVALWVSILVLIIYNWRRDRKASYFLIPYLAWVSFAGVLNYLSIK